MLWPPFTLPRVQFILSPVEPISHNINIITATIAEIKACNSYITLWPVIELGTICYPVQDPSFPISRPHLQSPLDLTGSLPFRMKKK